MASVNAVVPFEAQELVSVPNSNVVFPVSVLKKIPRTALSIKDKVIIIEMAEQKRMKLTEIAERFGLAKSTLSTLVKNKEKILNAYRTMKDPSRKRVRAAAYPDLEEMLFNWISDVNASGKIVSPQLLKVKAEGFARRLGIPSFRTSAGWLHNFKKRNGLKFPKATTKSVGPEFSNIINRNSIVNYHQVNHDSDGAASERSSDSESTIHPVQLLQYERPKRLKKSLCESNPDFIFYDNSVSQMKASDQMIVPYVHNSDQPEWPDRSADNILEAQVKIEEPDEEEEEDDDVEHIEPSSSLSSADRSPRDCPVEPEVIISSDIKKTSPQSLLRASSNSSGCIDSPVPAKENVPTILANRSDGQFSKQQNCSEDEIGIVLENTQLEAVFKHPLGSDGKWHTCESMRRLSQSLERQAKAQEELLALKKQRMSAEEKHRKEEIDLLRKKLAIEEKKVSVLEQLLAAYMQHPKTP